jgi:hypothetical protein
VVPNAESAEISGAEDIFGPKTMEEIPNFDLNIGKKLDSLSFNGTTIVEHEDVTRNEEGALIGGENLAMLQFVTILPHVIQY